MERTTGHQAQQPPAVVIVQQPIVVGQGNFVRGQPFLRRGVKINNGMTIGGSCISCLGVFGFILAFMGLIFTIVGINTFVGIIFLLVGGGMLAACFKFCHKAKQDYDALPQDHPDRVTYSTPVYRPHTGGGGSVPIATTAAYQFPPGTQFITSSTVQGGGQPIINYQLPHGAQVINPSAMGQPGVSYLGGNIILPQQLSGAVPITPPPIDDKPPSYEEVCKDGRR